MTYQPTSLSRCRRQRERDVCNYLGHHAKAWCYPKKERNIFSITLKYFFVSLNNHFIIN